MTQLWRSYSGFWPLVVVLLLVALVAVLVRYRERRLDHGPGAAAFGGALLDVGVLLNLGLVAVLTLTPAGSGRSLNLVPFREVRDLWAHPSAASAPVIEIWGNLILFVPAAVLLATRPTWPARRVVRWVFLAALSIECVQWAAGLGRVASVTDVLLPCLGAVLGAGLVRSVRLRDRQPQGVRR